MRPKARSRAEAREPAGAYLLTVKGRKKGALQDPAAFRRIFHAPPIEKVDVIKAGVAPDVVNDIADAMGAGQDAMLRSLGIAKSTWARKRLHRAPLETHDSERLLGLAALIGQVQALVEEQGEPKGFDAAKWFCRWIEEPVPALGGKKPAELLDTKAGQQVVSELLAGIRSGAYM